MILPADPKRNYLAHKAEIDEAVHRVMDGGWYILGEEVAEFEREFAAYLGLAHGIGVGSGTEAVQLALRACGVGPGDFVITVSHTAVATVAAIELAGAAPILVDVDRETFTMSVPAIEAALNTHGRRVKAIVPVHLYGHPADIVNIVAAAAEHNVFVVEDCAQSHGAAFGGQKTGTFGQIAAFSFYPTKNLGALGDGGAIVTNDSGLAERAKLLRQYGWRTRYISETAGLNSRLDEMQAAILRVKLRYLDDENRRRRHIASRYEQAFSSTTLRLPVTKPQASHVFHQFTVRSDRRDSLQALLKEAGVGAAILYPQPVHLQQAYWDRVQTCGGMENTEQQAREILSIPIHPDLTGEEVECVIDAVRRSA